jgi:aspartyl-tRNA synthetase
VVDDEKLQELQIISMAGDFDIEDVEEFNPDE